MMLTKENTLEKMAAQLKSWDGQLTELVRRAEKAEDSVKSDFFKQSHELRLKYKAAEVQLERLKAASSDKWDEFKSDLGGVWSDVEKSFKNLTH